MSTVTAINPLYGKRVAAADLSPAQAAKSHPHREATKTVWRRAGDGLIHRKRSPAVIHHNGIEEWRQEGHLHREDGPAFIAPNTDTYGDLPYGVIEETANLALGEPEDESIEALYGPGEMWLLEGKLHRDDGPAISDYSSVYESRTVWFYHGKLHREDGPAYEIINEEDRGTVRLWFLNGQRHREDGPAVEEDGYKEWYRHGKLHREDGPAIEDANGTTKWFINGEQHRENGPAVIKEDGTKQWWLNGEELTEQEWREKPCCVGQVRLLEFSL